ncbi:unnamed protein product [Schistocephalus solidus]|uniref:Uncharacterized protein n=1 Tax=Schistocephalus solidus TaxID=70667 RepID=A0A183SU56_SCHSO|nr:unnamed protein product [Schistocephalus solidus]
MKLYAWNYHPPRQPPSPGQLHLVFCIHPRGLADLEYAGNLKTKISAWTYQPSRPPPNEDIRLDIFSAQATSQLCSIASHGLHSSKKARQPGICKILEDEAFRLELSTAPTTSQSWSIASRGLHSSTRASDLTYAGSLKMKLSAWTYFPPRQPRSYGRLHLVVCVYPRGLADLVYARSLKKLSAWNYQQPQTTSQS